MKRLVRQAKAAMRVDPADAKPLRLVLVGSSAEK